MTWRSGEFNELRGRETANISLADAARRGIAHGQAVKIEPI